VDSADIEQEETAQGPGIDLERYFLTLRRYIWLIAAFVVLVAAGAVVYTRRLVPVYEATASVQIEPKLPDLLGTGDMFNVASGNSNTTEYYKQQQLVIGSYTLCQQTVQANDFVPKLLSPEQRAVLTKEDQVDIASRQLKEDLKVKYPVADRIMYVSVRSSDPKFAKDVANAHIATYVNYSKGLLAMNSTEASGALEQEFNQAEQELRKAEEHISTFQAENDMVTVTLEEHQSLVASNILSFTQKLNDARAEQIRLAARLDQMRKASVSEVLSSPMAMMSDSSSSFETLRAQYYAEKTKLIELERDLGPKNSEYATQKQKVDELFKALDGQLKILMQGTQALYQAQSVTVAGLAAEVERYKTEAKALSPKIADFNRLMRDKRGIEDNYNILRTRLSTSQMTGGMSASISNVRPLDPALLPTASVYPSMSKNVAFSSAAALFIAVGFVVLAVFLDRSIKSAGEATQAAKAPVLGVIPGISPNELPLDDDRARDLFVHEHPTSHIAECCRTLRTNIMLSSADNDLKMIVVCSANKSEGKTTSVMYLGTTMAQSNQRVLLIDTDMRRPRLHTSFGASRERGLTNLIMGDDNYDDVIQTTDVPNLFLLPCGPLPPNPVELLMTKRFAAVLTELGQRFDRIILDSPPLPYTDAVVISKLTGGVILIVRAGKTLRDELTRASRTFREVNANVLGVIVNDLDRQGGDAANYYYYSYYGYGDQARDDASKRRSATRAARRASKSSKTNDPDDANIS
jgi:capsular exopolysaccharide synthesis family protein